VSLKIYQILPNLWRVPLFLRSAEIHTVGPILTKYCSVPLRSDPDDDVENLDSRKNTVIVFHDY